MMHTVVFMLLLCGAAQGKDLGTFGPTFPILEKSIIRHILERLKTLEETGELQKHQESIVKTVMDRLHHLEPVEGISHTEASRTFTFDPSICVSQDLKDHQGKVFFKKGARVNPLHTRPLTKPLLFIDGDAPHHHIWLQQQIIHYPRAKVIFVKGDPFAWTEHYDFPIFYDQGGTLTSKLGIHQVPAKVTQEGDFLRIDEERADTEGPKKEVMHKHGDGDPHG